MPRTPDRFPGEREEEGILFDTTSSAPPAVDGEFRYVQGVGFKLFEGGAEKRVLSVEDHQALRSLIHFIDEGPASGYATGAYKETTYSGSPWPTAVTWYVSSAKAQKIVEKTYTRNSENQATIISWVMYAADGVTPSATVTDTVTYSGISEVSRTRAIS